MGRRDYGKGRPFFCFQEDRCFAEWMQSFASYVNPDVVKNNAVVSWSLIACVDKEIGGFDGMYISEMRLGCDCKRKNTIFVWEGLQGLFFCFLETCQRLFLFREEGGKIFFVEELSGVPSLVCAFSFFFHVFSLLMSTRKENCL